MSSGNLIKLKIIQYQDDRFENPSGTEMDIPVNPSNYKRNVSIEYNEEQEQGTQGNNPSYSRTPPEEMQFDFVFDNTGVLPGSRKVDVQIAAFKELAYSVDGDIHRPNFLKILWGSLSFNCILKALTINYTLFKPDGTPVRAMLNTTFLNVVEEERRAVEQGNNSPDLTHIRYSKEGDTLALLTYNIYKDASLFPQVAKFNGFTNLRKLKPNTRIVFPPIDRSLK